MYAYINVFVKLKECLGSVSSWHGSLPHQRTGEGLELRILPLQAGAPIYLPREADKTPGESVKSITVSE